MTTAGVRRELIWVCIVSAAGFLITFTTIKAYRARGHQPVFYQQNFGPAVMMACGYGFTQPPYAAAPPSLLAFLRLERDDFNCGDLPQPMPTEPVSWNGTQYGWLCVWNTTTSTPASCNVQQMAYNPTSHTGAGNELMVDLPNNTPQNNVFAADVYIGGRLTVPNVSLAPGVYSAPLTVTITVLN